MANHQMNDSIYMADIKDNTTLAAKQLKTDCKEFMAINVNSKPMETSDLSKTKTLQFKYKQHRYTTAGNKCPICRKKFSFRQNLLRHIHRNHHNVKSFNCRHCNLLFSNGQYLARHMKIHEDFFNIKHVCEYCSKTFKSICHLYQHLMLHVGENGLWEKTLDNNDSSYQNLNTIKCDNRKLLIKKHVCEICSKSFTGGESLRCHLKLHTEKSGINRSKVHLNKRSKHICGICSRAFKNEHSLKRHLGVHSKERPYSCTVCNATYKRKHNLTLHNIKTHKKYICKFCSKSFLIFDELNYHLTSHAEERPYKCNVCNRGYKYKRNMLHHKKTHFEHKCEICFQYFQDRSSLDCHLQQKHYEGNSFTNKNITKNIETYHDNESSCVNQDSEREKEINFSKYTEQSTANYLDQNYSNVESKEKINLHNTDNLPEKYNSNNDYLGCIQVKEEKDSFISADLKDTINKTKNSMESSTVEIYCCSMCNKSFKRLSFFNKHQKIHKKNDSQTFGQVETITKANQIKYPVSINDKKDPTSLTPSISIECKECSKSFCRQSSLLRHLKTVHSEERPYTCSLCNKSFNQINQLKIHRKIHLNRDSKICEQGDLKIINVNEKKKSNPNKDKKDLKKENDMNIQILGLINEEYLSNKKPSQTIKSPKGSKFSKDICQQNDQSFLNIGQQEKYENFVEILEHSKDNSQQYDKSCLNKNKELVHESKFFAFLKDSDLTKEVKEDSTSEKQFKNIKFKLEVQKDLEDNFNKEGFNYIKSKGMYDNNSSSSINQNQDKERLKTTHNVLEQLTAPTAFLDSNQFNKNVIKADSIDLQLQQDIFGNQINKVFKIKEEYSNDNDSNNDCGFNSVLEIFKTQFIYDEAIVNSAKRKETNTPTYDLTQANENWNTTDSSNELHVFNKNNYKTKLKLRYKLLKGKCTICNKTFNCPKDYVEHGLKFHSNPEAFNSPNTQYKTLIPENLPMKFSCHICTSSFHNYSNLENHLSEHTRNVNVENHQEKHMEPVSCISDKETNINKSKNTIPTPVSTKNHSNSTSTTNNKINTDDALYKYICKFCSKAFRLEHILKFHLRSHDSDLLRSGHDLKKPQTVQLEKKYTDLKRIETDSILPTKKKITQFLIPTIKVNDVETCDNQYLSKNHKRKAHKSFGLKEMPLEEEFISLINTDDIKEEEA